MRPKKLLRSVFTLQFDRRLDAWVLLAGGTVIDLFGHYGTARQCSAGTAKLVSGLAGRLNGKHATHRLVAQLRIRRKDGTWASERTYGADPKRRKG